MAVLSSSDGVAFDVTDAVADDVVKAVSVPGKSRADLGEIPWTGTSKEYKGRSDKTWEGVILTLALSSHVRGNIQRFHPTRHVVIVLYLIEGAAYRIIRITTH